MLNVCIAARDHDGEAVRIFQREDALEVEKRGDYYVAHFDRRGFWVVYDLDTDQSADVQTILATAGIRCELIDRGGKNVHVYLPISFKHELDRKNRALDRAVYNASAEACAELNRSLRTVCSD